MEKFDYQILTSSDKWEGSGIQATKKEIKAEIKAIKERLKDEGRGGEELVIFIAPKMEQYTDSTFA